MIDWAGHDLLHPHNRPAWYGTVLRAGLPLIFFLTLIPVATRHHPALELAGLGLWCAFLVARMERSGPNDVQATWHIVAGVVGLLAEAALYVLGLPVLPAWLWGPVAGLLALTTFAGLIVWAGIRMRSARFIDDGVEMVTIAHAGLGDEHAFAELHAFALDLCTDRPDRVARVSGPTATRWFIAPAVVLRGVRGARPEPDDDDPKILGALLEAEARDLDPGHWRISGPLSHSEAMVAEAERFLRPVPRPQDVRELRRAVPSGDNHGLDPRNRPGAAGTRLRAFVPAGALLAVAPWVAHPGGLVLMCTAALYAGLVWAVETAGPSYRAAKVCVGLGVAGWISIAGLALVHVLPGGSWRPWILLPAAAAAAGAVVWSGIEARQSKLHSQGVRRVVVRHDPDGDAADLVNLDSRAMHLCAAAPGRILTVQGRGWVSYLINPGDVDEAHSYDVARALAEEAREINPQWSVTASAFD